MSGIYDVTIINTLIRQLVSTSQQSVGVLTSIIQLLVKIHNSFIDKYRETFPKKQFRYVYIRSYVNTLKPPLSGRSRPEGARNWELPRSQKYNG